MYNLKDVNRSVKCTINRFLASKPALFCSKLYFESVYR